MPMCRYNLSLSFLSWNYGVVLAVLVALTLSIVSAAPPEKAQSEPLAPPDVPPIPLPVEFRPEHLASLILTAPTTPLIGRCSAMSIVYAGASIEEPVWDLRGVFSTKAGRINVGATLLFLSGFGPPATMPLSELTMLQAGAHRDCWELINTDELRPFPEFFLAPGFIKDRTGNYTAEPEYEAYWRVLVQSHYTSAKAFARKARHDVTYANLFHEPEHYRGEVIHLSGRMIRLQGWPAPAEARAAGVAIIYEAWIMTDAYGENPVCVAFTDLPDGLKVDNDRKYNEEVSVDGYFYKRYRYKAADSRKANEFRDAPLLIAHTLVGRFGRGGPIEETENWGHNLIWVFLSVVGGALVLVVVLTVWFRFHDRRVHHRLSASRNRDFVSPSEEESFLPEDGGVEEKPTRMPFFD